MPSFDMTDRVAIVTGGSQGFGKAIALALAHQGANVVVAAREPEQVTVGRERPHAPVYPVVDEIRAIGSRALGVTADVRNQDELDAMVAQTMDEFGRIDALVNVVGGSWGETFRSGPLMELEPHDFIECYRVNVLTAFMCSKAVQPIMKAQGKGAIVNIASGAGRQSRHGAGGLRRGQGGRHQHVEVHGVRVGAGGPRQRHRARRHRDTPSPDVARERPVHHDQPQRHGAARDAGRARRHRPLARLRRRGLHNRRDDRSGRRTAVSSRLRRALCCTQDQSGLRQRRPGKRPKSESLECNSA